MKKLMVGLVLLGAFAWFWLLGTSSGESSSFISYTYLSSGTSDSTVVITGKPAGSLCLFNAGVDITAITWNNSNSSGASVPGGSSMTWTGVEVYQYTIDRTNATEVYVWTW